MCIVADGLTVDGLRLGISGDNDVIDRGVVVIHIFHLQLRLQSFLLPLPIAVAGNDDDDGNANHCSHNCTGNGSCIIAGGIVVIALIGIVRTIAVVVAAVVVAALVVAVRVVAHRL